MAALPKTYKKLSVQKLTTNFREAVTIETVELCKPQEGEVCIRNKYVGINASDINFTKGRYYKDVKLPFDIGLEGVGEIAQIGSGVTDLKIGDSVAYFSQKFNAYAEYCCIPNFAVYKIPEVKPEYLVILMTGFTAATGLDKNARIQNGEKVLITAAAGGTGHIAMQWAKAAGCHVIGTCSSEEKEKVLKNLGCDRIINYKKEDLGQILSKEYPEGIDVIWETIGGEVFQACFENLGAKGRLLVVGEISGYKDENNRGSNRGELSNLLDKLVYLAASVRGHHVIRYKEYYSTYFKYLADKLESGKLKAICDFGKENELVGIESIIDGVEYLYSGKSIGKVIVKVW